MTMENLHSPFLYNRPQQNTGSLKKAIVYKLIFAIGRSPEEASQRDWLNATLFAVRDLVTEGWISTANDYREANSRRVYYLSMEFLIGRTLSNALIAEGVYDLAKEALNELNVDLEEILKKRSRSRFGQWRIRSLSSLFYGFHCDVKYSGNWLWYSL